MVGKWMLLVVVNTAVCVGVDVNECSPTPCGIDQTCLDPDTTVPGNFVCKCNVGTYYTVGGPAQCIVYTTPQPAAVDPPGWTFPPTPTPTNSDGTIIGPVTHKNKWIFLLLAVLGSIIGGIFIGYSGRRHDPKPEDAEDDTEELRPAPPLYSKRSIGSIHTKETIVDGYRAQVRCEDSGEWVPVAYYDEDTQRWMPWTL
eukprot:TRINITY_DN21614_c0_g1_i1.p1 TRINITY_DN21614_c0_g1~~TRINITY_DN21614_c0_g1_i1.p1  ORF type:complete len:199 (+),score=20.85 TRINITY_DN21614_c0_g1_i1:36-632(+)